MSTRVNVAGTVRDDLNDCSRHGHHLGSYCPKCDEEGARDRPSLLFAPCAGGCGKLVAFPYCDDCEITNV
jgi:hypothetical protein